MVGTRDRVPLWNWSLVRRSPPAPCRRGPRTRSYPFSSVSGFQGSRGVFRRPAPPLPSVRGARRYITRTPSRGQGGIAPFSWEGAPRVAAFPMRPGITRFDCPSGRAHNSYISPGKDVGRRFEHPDAQGRESTKCSRVRLTKRARPLGAPNNCRAESIEAKSAEEVDASLYSSFLPAETFPALQWHPYYRKRPSASRAPGLLNG